MEKRFQVFVSSTFRDLQIERQQVMQALLELYCIPAGMELFPASDEAKWNLIRRVIDDCDVYPGKGWVRGESVDPGMANSLESMKELGLSRIIPRAQLEVSDIAFRSALEKLKLATGEDKDFLIIGKTLSFISGQIPTISDALENAVRLRFSVIDPTPRTWDSEYTR